jgi:hypothetical protein
MDAKVVQVACPYCAQINRALKNWDCWLCAFCGWACDHYSPPMTADERRFWGGLADEDLGESRGE